MLKGLERYLQGMSHLRTYSLLLGVLIPLCAFAQEDGGLVLTESEATRIAITGNPLVNASDAEVEASRAGLRAAWGHYIPKVKVRSLLSALPELRGDAVSGYTDMDLDKWGPFFRVQVTTTSPIYAFGQLSSLREEVRSQKAQAFARRTILTQELTYQVKRAMEGWRLARSLGDILEEGRGHLSKARARLEELEEEDSDEFDQIDLLKLRVYESELVRRETEVEEGVVAAREGLRLALGFGQDAPFTLERWKLKMWEFELKPLLEYQELAVAHHGELIHARAQVRERRAAVDVAKTQMYPSFGLDSFYRYSVAPSAQDQASPFAYDPYNQQEVGVGLSLSWNLAFGESLARLDQKQALERAESFRYLDRVAKVRMAVAEIYEVVSEARRLQAVNRKALKSARAWLMAKSDLYDGGLCPLEELNDALLAYFERKIGYEQAVHDHNVAAARLEQLIGGGLNGDELPESARP